MHDHAGGVIYVKGDDDEKTDMGKVGIAVETIGDDCGVKG